MKNCQIDGCAKPVHCKALCRNHYYKKLLRGGDPSVNLNWKGGIRRHPLYSAWAGMVNRCTNPNNSSYPRYGGKGVTVCARWLDFRNFLADMGERPPGKTLDRIDGSKGYEPGNCRWATLSEQRQNISADGDAKTRAAASASKTLYWERWRRGEVTDARRGRRRGSSPCATEPNRGAEP